MMVERIKSDRGTKLGGIFHSNLFSEALFMGVAVAISSPDPYLDLLDGRFVPGRYEV